MVHLGRRGLLRNVGAAALIWPGQAPARTKDELIAADAGALTVGPGPWPPQPRLPKTIRLENILLRMPDGVHLNGFLYLPASMSRDTRIACALKTDPYRNRTDRADDAIALARAGFAALILDVRGTGGSEGVPEDEYSHQEHIDTVAVIDWLAKQPWSNGRVGMWGISYSAFNSLQIAYDFHPPALRAIFIGAGTDDRYLDDIHMPGGCMLMVDNSWALGMLSDNASPGAPDFVMNDQAAMDRWNAPAWLDVFLKYQRDGAHWRRGSLAPDYGRLTTPTFLCAGYRDGYLDFVPRIMTRSPAVTMAVMGPWHHSLEWPGPSVDWDGLKIRWFDHWLRGHDTGMLKEPKLTYYMPRWRPQSFRFRGAVPGEWRAADTWPDSAITPPLTLYFVPAEDGPGGLADLPPGPSSRVQPYRPGRGSLGEAFGATNGEGWFGADWREEDTGGIAFDTRTMDQPLEMFGNAKARLYVSATAPVAHWMVRVNDVAPDGTSYMVARGFLNGTHRHSHTDPAPMIPGEIVVLDVNLLCVGYRFDVGHRLRVVVDNAAFPVMWPAPHAMQTTLYFGGAHASCIRIPQLAAGPARTPTLPILGDAVSKDNQRAYDGVSSFEIIRQERPARSEVSVTMGYPPTVNRIVCAVDHDDPARASVSLDQSVVQSDAGAAREIVATTQGRLSSTVETFDFDMTITLTENGKRVRQRRWTDSFKRDLV